MVACRKRKGALPGERSQKSIQALRARCIVRSSKRQRSSVPKEVRIITGPRVRPLGDTKIHHQSELPWKRRSGVEMTYL